MSNEKKKPDYACACGWQGDEPINDEKVSPFVCCPKCRRAVTFGSGETKYPWSPYPHG